MSLRVLVTGATGLIGRHSRTFLEEAGLDVQEASSKDADLLDPDGPRALIATTRPTHLLHLAWDVAPGYLESPENARWKEASLSLLREFAEAGGERAVVAGTCFEYDVARGVLSEASTPIAPASVYGRCKAQLWAAAQELGLSLVCGRIFFAYGPGDYASRLIPSAARRLLAGEEAPVSHGRQRRDYIHARDVASAFAALVAGDVEGAVNVGTGVAVELRKIVDTLAGQIGRPELVRYGALPSPEDEPPLIEADVGRLRDELGWSPSVSLEEGLAECVESARAAADRGV